MEFIAPLLVLALILLLGAFIGGYALGYSESPNYQTRTRLEALRRAERIHQKTYATLAAMADEVARSSTGK